MKPIIAKIYIFKNGMTAVFDINGIQQPQFQGEWKKVYKKLLREINEDTKIFDQRW